MYLNKYGAETLNDLSDDQLMEAYSNAKSLSIAGGVITGTGVILMGSGILTAMVNITEDILSMGSSHDSYGEGLFISGAVLTIGGAIVWITGGSRKTKMSPLIKSRGQSSNISVYPCAGYEFLTDRYYPALTISIGF